MNHSIAVKVTGVAVPSTQPSSHVALDLLFTRTVPSSIIDPCCSIPALYHPYNLSSPHKTKVPEVPSGVTENHQMVMYNHQH